MDLKSETHVLILCLKTYVVGKSRQNIQNNHSLCKIVHTCVSNCICELLISKERKGPEWFRGVHGGGRLTFLLIDL